MAGRSDYIPLLRLALQRREVSEARFFIPDRPDQPDQDRKLHLRRAAGGSWQVYYTERGDRSSEVTFPDLYDAVNFFYWSLTDAPTPWTAQRGDTVPVRR